MIWSPSSSPRNGTGRENPRQSPCPPISLCDTQKSRTAPFPCCSSLFLFCFIIVFRALLRCHASPFLPPVPQIMPKSKLRAPLNYNLTWFTSRNLVGNAVVRVCCSHKCASSEETDRLSYVKLHYKYPCGDLALVRYPKSSFHRYENSLRAF